MPSPQQRTLTRTWSGLTASAHHRVPEISIPVAPSRLRRCESIVTPEGVLLLPACQEVKVAEAGVLPDDFLEHQSGGNPAFLEMSVVF